MTATAALILAGGKNKPEMQAACGGVENRALVDLNGRPMLDYVVEALRVALPGVRLLVAGDVSLPAGAVAVPGGDSLVDTLMNGVAALDARENRLLVATADIPFVTSEALTDFLRRAEAAPAEFHYPIVSADRCRERFPEMRRTTLRIAEGRFTGGNVVLLDPSFLRAKEATIRAAYARRKSVVGLASLLGAALPARLLLSRIVPGMLAIPHLEAAVSRALGGVRVRAVISDFPEIGADVDRPEDVEQARRWLAAKNGRVQTSV